MKLSRQKEGAVGEVLDEETGLFVDITPEMMHEASYVHNQVLMGAFISAVSIKRIFDEKLYLAMNCCSKEEYCNNMLPFGKRQAYKLYAVANKFDAVSKSLTGNALKEIGSGDTSQFVHLNSQSEIDENFAGMGISKLYELTKIDDEDFAELVKTGKTKINNTDLDIDEIIEMKGKELQKKINEALKKYKDKTSQQAEKIKLLEEEAKTNEKDYHRLLTKEKDLKLIEAQYGPEATKIEQKIEYMNMAEASLDEFMRVFNNANILPEDPEELRRKAQDITRKIHMYHERAQNLYIEVFPDVE